MNFSSRHNIYSWSQNEGRAYITEGANIRGNTVFQIKKPNDLIVTFVIDDRNSLHVRSMIRRFGESW